MMTGYEQDLAARRRDVDGLRGLLIAMGLSGALWAGMVGMVGMVQGLMH